MLNTGVGINYILAAHFSCTPHTKPKCGLQRSWTPSLQCMLTPLPEVSHLPTFQDPPSEPETVPQKDSGSGSGIPSRGNLWVSVEWGLAFLES